MGSSPILIIGGGPVGLALAGDLGWRGQNALLVEQSELQEIGAQGRWSWVPACAGRTERAYLARSITSIAVMVDWAASMVKLILSPGLMPLSSDGGATG